MHNIIVSQTKKIFFVIIFFMFSISSSFGQTPPPPIWTTVAGSSVRNIPMSSVKSEVLRIADQYRFYGIADESRNTFRARLATDGNGPLLRTWVDNNQNFVFALQDRTNILGVFIDLANVTFAIGDRIYSLGFFPNSSPFALNSVQNDRRYLEQLIDSYLSGMVTGSNQSSTTDNRPLITIINRTGFTIWYVYVSPTTSTSWGSDILRPDQVLTNGQSINIRLGQPLNQTNRYDIRIIDLDGDSYTKRNVLISNNATITFTFDDFDF